MIKVHLRAYLIDQILRFPQQISQEPVGFLLFDRAECCSATPGPEQTVEEFAILAEPIIAIKKEQCFTKANQVGCHGHVWSIRTFDALFLEYP